MDSIAQSITEALNGVIPPELIVFLISMMPILELRGGLIAAGALQIDWITAYLVCFFGTMLPIPFILIFIRKIFQWLKRFKFWEKKIEFLEIRAMRKSSKVQKYSKWGLLIFVAVPLPGTGAWMGSLIAALMDMRIKSSLPTIAIGTAIAGFIMTAISYGLFGVLNQI